MARVLVTGGAGFIGSQLVQALVQRGDEVVALARSAAAAEALSRTGARVVRGDVLDGESVAAAIAGCAVVHHVAGVNAHCPRDPDRLWQVNVLGPETIVQAAARAGVERVVLTSSAATIGEPPGMAGSERTEHRGWFLSLYEHSKYEGERAALRAAELAGLELVALCPTSVQGPPRSGGTGAIVIAYLNGRLRVFVDTVVSVVDVADVVAAHLLAERRGKPGGRYVLSGPGLRSGEALALLAELSGVRHRVVFIPAWAARRLAAAVSFPFELSGRVSPACSARIETILHGHRYDGSLAERELGLSYTPVAETFARTIEWARAAGLVAA